MGSEINDGKRYESLVAQLYRALTEGDKRTTVKVNDRIRGCDGLRETDVAIRSKVGDYELLTIVECKDHKRKVDRPIIEAFCKKLEDVGASKGIVVSRSGFTKSAIQLANRSRIDVYSADHIGRISLPPEHNLPIAVRSLIPDSFHSEVHFSNPTRVDLKLTTLGSFFCDRSLVEIIGSLPVARIASTTSLFIDFSEEWPDQELWIRGAAGEKLPVSTARFWIKFSEAVHFGYLGDLPDSAYKRNEVTSEATFFIDIRDITAAGARFKRYDNLNSLPVFAQNPLLLCFTIPDAFPESEYTSSASVCKKRE